MATVKLTNVKKIYGKNTVAVHDFNLEIADKEFVVFVGPSGCGKSTTLRMIAGLEEISGGTVEIDGKVVNDLQPKDRDIAMVFQNYALYPNLTVFENMAFPLRLKKIPHEVTNEKTGKTHIVYEKLSQEEIYSRVTEISDILGITQYLLRKPRELSGGQRQRVAIGRAMVRDSKVFLLDEPLSNLDAKLRNQMRAELILLRRKIDSTFIYVTHDQTEAMTLGDRIVIMKDGFIMQIGTPSELFDMPANLFVAEFIGSPKMNTFPTRLEKDEDRNWFVTCFGVKMPVDGAKADDLNARGVEPEDIILGVRPEHVSLTRRDNPAGIPCTIKVNEMMGSEVHLHVEAPDGTELIVRVTTVSLTAEQQAALVPGTRLYLTFRSKVMHFFSKATQRNLLSDYIPIESTEPEEDVTLPTLTEEEILRGKKAKKTKAEKEAEKRAAKWRKMSAAAGKPADDTKDASEGK